MRRLNYWVFVIGILLSCTVNADTSKVQVFAAASLTDAMTELAKQYTQQTGVQVSTVYGGSGTLAKQIEQGAPADLFVSADEKWMQYLKDKQSLQADTIKPWLSNRLVMIAPNYERLTLNVKPETEVDKVVSGYWCTGDTLSVPVGIYAKQALSSLGWWDKIKARLVSTQDVRATLTLVERGECQVGIVYASDALVSKKVKVIGEFEANMHSPIIYPLAILKESSSTTVDFYRYLLSAEAKKVLARYGFKPLF